MSSLEPSREPDTLQRLRGWLLALLILGMTGALADLWLIGHYEDPWQLVPVVLLGLGLVACFLVLWRRDPVAIRLLRGCMGLFVLAGLVGLYLHFDGNAEFEKEMYPNLAGFELIWEALRGATPALAPATMVQLGLLGLLHCYRHPAEARRPYPSRILR